MTGDTWVMMTSGPRQVVDLIGTVADVLVDGQAFPTKAPGFFEAGVKDVWQVRTSRGFAVKTTATHAILVGGGDRSEWVEVHSLRPGDYTLEVTLTAPGGTPSTARRTITVRR